jgi:transcription elongation factor GreA
MDKPTYLTEEGLRKLKDELAELAGPKRTQLAQRLRAAIQMGDLSENADYSAAKEEQAFLEGRIQELTQLLGTWSLSKRIMRPAILLKLVQM